MMDGQDSSTASRLASLATTSVSRRSVLAAGGAFVALTAVSACGGGNSGKASKKTKTSLAIAGGLLGNWDPANGAHLFSTAGQAVYDPLVLMLAEDDKVRPSLAESWELSSDRQSATLTLRQGVTFIDGSVLDGPGVEKAFAAILHSPGFTWKARLVDEFKMKLTATGKQTVKITTALPMGLAFWWQLALTPVASPRAAGNPRAFANGPVGSGPYLVDKLVPDSSVTLRRNPHYWDPRAFPYDGVTITQISDPGAALNALRSGQIDAAQLTIPLAQEAKSAGLKLTTGPGTNPSIFVMDLAGKIVPALADVRVRQAMAMAFDRAAINKSLNLGYGVVSSQPFLKGQPGYVEGADNRYPFDVARAKSLLAAAGYPNGFDVTIPTLTGVTTDFEPIVQQSLADIGIRVTYKSGGADIAGLLKAFASRKYPLAIFPTASTNWVNDPYETYGFSTMNPTFDRWYHTTSTGTPEQEKAAFQQAGQYLLDQCWYIVFSHNDAVFASTAQVDIGLQGGYSNPFLRQYTPAH